MGHQINFFLLPSDVAEVEKRLRQKSDFRILHERSSTAAPKQVDTLNLLENGRQWLSLRLVRSEDLDNAVTRYIPEQGYWIIESSKSPVVEFSGCYFNQETLRRGRMYYVDSDYDTNSEWQYKSEVFRKWAKSLLATTKRLLKRSHASFYIGPDAAA